MSEELQILIQAIKDYGAAIISTLSVGGIAAVAGVIAKVKSGIDKTKEQMNSLLAKKDEESSKITDQYKSVLVEINEQNKKIAELTAEISKIEK